MHRGNTFLFVNKKSKKKKQQQLLLLIFFFSFATCTMEEEKAYFAEQGLKTKTYENTEMPKFIQDLLQGNLPTDKAIMLTQGQGAFLTEVLKPLENHDHEQKKKKKKQPQQKKKNVVVSSYNLRSGKQKDTGDE